MKVAPLEIGGVRIEAVDYRALTDNQIAALNTFENTMSAESRPDDPPEPLWRTEAFVRNLPDFWAVHEFWGFAPDGSLAAEGYAFWTETDENRHLAFVGIAVRPDHRRRGIGRKLLRLVGDVARAEGRNLLMGNTIDRVPAGDAFASAVGAELGMATHTNRLVLADVDRALIDRWIEQGPTRAPDYSLIWIASPYPDDQLAAVADIMGVMNTAPRDDLQMEDEHRTPEQVRQWEASMLAGGTERWSLFARHEPTGLLVGFTEVGWNATQPKTVGQGDTGVRPEHRGHALGKWLKATMLSRILNERPEAEDVRTGNADSNDAMLGINHQLGFRPYIAQSHWQVPLDRVRAYLDGSSS